MTCLAVSLRVICGFLLFLPACSTGPVVSQMIIDEATRVVRVDVTYRTGKDEHSHPAIVSPEELNQALQSLLVEPSSFLPISFKNAESGTGAFSEEERHFLALHAAQALSRATPLEEVLFYWVHPRDINIQEVTSGSLYVQDGGLHVVLANVRQTTTSQGDVDRARENPLEVLGQSLYFVDPGPEGRTAPESSWEKWFSQPRQHLFVPLKPVPSRGADRDHTLRLPSSTTNDTPSSLREKLKELQSLRDEGMVSEEEYQSKRRELLERF